MTIDGGTPTCPRHRFRHDDATSGECRSDVVLVAAVSGDDRVVLWRRG